MMWILFDNEHEYKQTKGFYGDKMLKTNWKSIGSLGDNVLSERKYNQKGKTKTANMIFS